MVDREKALAAGLELGNSERCMSCHPSGHGRDFNLEAASKLIRHPNAPPEVSASVLYKNPLNLALSPDAVELYVACEASNSVIVVDVEKRRKVGEIEVGGQPHDVAFNPDGTIVYVSNRLDDTVSVINTAARTVVKTVQVGDEPHGLLTDQLGEQLFVLNTAEDNISIVATSDLREVKRLSASRNPWSLALSPDGNSLLVTNTLSRLVGFREPLVSEITGIEVERGIVDQRPIVPDANLLQGIAWHPAGDFALFTLTRTKNLIPMTRLLQGWTLTNGAGIAWRDGHVDQVLLDEPNLAFPDPADVAFTPNGQFAFVTSSGSNRMAVVDVPKLVKMLGRASEHERLDVFPNHLGKPTEFVVKHIPTGRSPRGIVVTPDGATAF
ncbi:MAG: YncE family protein, partial [bacterium]